VSVHEFVAAASYSSGWAPPIGSGRTPSILLFVLVVLFVLFVTLCLYEVGLGDGKKDVET
jgi:hypothetical protein